MTPLSNAMNNQPKKNDSQLVGAVAIATLVAASAVSAAVQTSPWFASQVASLTGLSVATVTDEGGCCGGGCAVE